MKTIRFDLTDNNGNKTYDIVLNKANIGYLIFNGKNLEIHTTAGTITCQEGGGVEKLFNFIYEQLQ